MKQISVDNKSFKNRNKGKVKTLIGGDEVFLNLLDFDFQLDGKKVLLKDILEKIYIDREELDKENQLLKEEIEEIKKQNKELKSALKEYIAQENQVDLANTQSLEILSVELAKANLALNELNDKTKFL
jgi:cell division protein FtsB